MTLEQICVSHYKKAKKRGWLPHFEVAALRYAHSQADLLAIASRESNMENIIGDRGNGFSLMQLDINSHREWIETGEWKDPAKAILKGAQALANHRQIIKRTSKSKVAGVKFRNGQTRTFSPRPLTEDALRHCTLAAYNCGGAAYYHYSLGHSIDAGTTGKDYGRDVMARAEIFARLLKADKPEPTPALDKVVTPLQQDEEGVTLKDVKAHVSSESLKSILIKVAAKVSAPIVGLWSAGAHGKIIITLAAIVILAVLGYEIHKHWPRISAFIKRVLA